MTDRTGTHRVTRPHLRWVVAAVVGCVVLTACDAPRPDVTFYGNRTAVETGPTRWCTVDVASDSSNCTDLSDDETARMTIGRGKSVQINVPAAIGPWEIYFKYLNKDGETIEGTVNPFKDGRLAYTLEPLDAKDQFVYLEVRSDLIVTGGGQGGAKFGVWALAIDPTEPAPNTPDEQ